ncbi:cation transporter [Candidatus Saganbacteria bacterium]|uniref:Cation transporter n=1 Tax=Candidatus Saganbacteria bacterium TaxID=2575572 RepID=A0A9D6ULX2_UNCSA|nr:cation transporter [Candidatus Saganbacteria bacterium]
MEGGKSVNGRNSLIAALSVTVIVFFVELIGGLVSNSLALLSDAGHMLTDIMALSLALAASIFASRQTEEDRTYGFYRLEILSALFNGILLTLVSLYIFYQAYRRFVHPAEVQSSLMLMVAVVGLLANISAAFILKDSHEENLNVRGAFVHVLSDLGASVAVIIGGLIIYFTRWYSVDPFLGVLIGLLILRGAVGLIKESADILLEAAPKGISVDEVENTIKDVKGIKEIHDLHIWTITSGINAISAHLLIEEKESGRAAEILREVGAMLKVKYNFMHSTFQTECEACSVCRR